MPARDIFHNAVRNALLKEGWTITDDPLFISFADVEFYIDIGAERVISAEKSGEKIAVEIKSFVGASAVTEFHSALGQYMNYRLALEKKDPERCLYLAVPTDTYDTFFHLEFGRIVIQHYQLRLIVYDVGNEVIVKWQKQTNTEI